MTRAFDKAHKEAPGSTWPGRTRRNVDLRGCRRQLLDRRELPGFFHSYPSFHGTVTKMSGRRVVLVLVRSRGLLVWVGEMNGQRCWRGIRREPSNGETKDAHESRWGCSEEVAWRSQCAYKAGTKQLQGVAEKREDNVSRQKTHRRK